MKAPRKKNRSRANRNGQTGAVIKVPQEAAQRLALSTQDTPAEERSRVLHQALVETAKELESEKDAPNEKRHIPSINIIRHHVVLAMIILIGATALGAMFIPQGMEVFNKLLPVFTFILGYFFPITLSR